PMKILGSATLLSLLSAPLLSQEPVVPISDNSFLIEEAYNQEEGVVQHISNFTRLWPGKGWAYSFTQEWPLGRYPRHQFSYTIPVVNPGSSSGVSLGDVALNYRYQLVGSGSAKVAFAPRLSVLLPTGDFRRELGFGGTAVQINLPLSVVVNKKLVTHWNAGTTIVPGARNPAGDRAAAFGYNLGQSFIWRLHPRFNAMLETVWVGSERVVAPGRTERQHSLFLNPGIRWAHNFPGGLQIVPGIAVPIGLGPSRGEKGIFLYLSFEHPFGKSKEGKRKK
ncbi:MAG: hypothetical protein ACRD3A_15235, partial [Terriglobales bacterium]